MIKNFESWINENVEFDGVEHTKTSGIPLAFMKRMAQLISEAKPVVKSKSGKIRKLEVEFAEKFPSKATLNFYDVSLNIFAGEEIVRGETLGDVNYFYAQDNDGTWVGGFEESLFDSKGGISDGGGIGAQMSPYEFLEAIKNEGIITSANREKIAEILHQEFPSLKPSLKYGI